MSRGPAKTHEAKCRSRFRIHSGDVIALGPGKVDLLEAIHEAGSISGAGRQLKLSYRRAWDMVAAINECFQEPLVLREKGGKGGGGASLTPAGQKIVKLYRSMEAKADKAVQKEWQSIKKQMRS